MRVPEDAERDFVAGCYVVEEGEILLMKHSKLGIWLQPGGHVDPDETPDEAAVRECREETGWEVELVDGNYEKYGGEWRSEDLPLPFNINLHRIREGHWHCEFSYHANPVERKEASHAHEHDGLEWFSEEEVRQLELPENIEASMLRALHLARDGNTSV